jgi:hypothetical protein
MPGHPPPWNANAIIIVTAAAPDSGDWRRFADPR